MDDLQKENELLKETLLKSQRELADSVRDEVALHAEIRRLRQVVADLEKELRTLKGE